MYCDIWVSGLYIVIKIIIIIIILNLNKAHHGVLLYSEGAKGNKAVLTNKDKIGIADYPRPGTSRYLTNQYVISNQAKHLRRAGICNQSWENDGSGVPSSSAMLELSREPYISSQQSLMAQLKYEGSTRHSKMPSNAGGMC